MNKKGSMELSVNSIVILVIAIVMLGLILGFVKSKFNSLDISQQEPEAPVATASNPLTVSRPTMSVNAGEETALKFSMFASDAIVASSNDIITLTCGSGTSSSTWGTTTGKNVAKGQVGTAIMIVKVPSTEAKGKQVCTAALSVATLTANSIPNPSIDILVTVK